MTIYLSKTDFKIGSSCHRKLWYKKNSYPTTNDENEYMEYLAKGGFIVGKYAQLIYDGGTDLSGIADWEQAVQETKRLIETNENIIIYEAAFYNSNKLARVDILEKKGRILNIIEVKAKSQASDDEDEKIPQEYLDDVLFQVITAEEAYPGFEINGFLLLPDKNKLNEIEGLAGWFVSEEGKESFVAELEELPARNATKFSLPSIKFKYVADPDKEKYLDQLKKYSILELRDIKNIDFNGDWEPAKAKLKITIKELLKTLTDGTAGEIGKKCKTCEYASDTNGLNGFKECWAEFKDQEPSVLDLYYGGSVMHGKGISYIDELIANKKISLQDIDLSVLTKGKAATEISDRVIRQLMQIDTAKTGKENVRKDILQSALESWHFPLYFIDFETYTGAIPFHKIMRPYDLVAFQWSCHKLNKDGSLEHFEWINTEESFPNFRFAESLMQMLGNYGTPLMWSHHENTTLRRIMEQMDVHDYKNEKLKKWLLQMTHDRKLKREGRLTDMAKLCEKTYVHPYSKGRFSIKKILPAIWNNDENNDLHNDPSFISYFRRNPEGQVMDPYKTLQPIKELQNMTELESEDVVAEGTAAMKAYYEMMYGKGYNNETKKKELATLLLQYCKLDTIAMVIIYKYWLKLTR